ncbi:hypothetical protein FOCG_09097 [Fusarium oxysporum f. sp. radicis-lycopersici 26381]|uniref:Uncharacterized protein n=1 Tax=Fusarium oxysporum Fo47 TaxID=660027 RepID=W9KBS5_FUSOX|nr:hypothetical protein FOZG_08506 [Fusarium oxysporum Fo47]EWZ83637.1 hypothetical protein FOWG_12604 [Fusarium oxysporum f. sp. lycopersici MN25]EXL50957.1 hypothetical protein FOCG_09097 [Fusarium oxysporum f. sp. radicis-lycopersici 26381]
MARPDCQNQYGGPADLAAASCFSSERAKMIALKRAGEDEMYDAEMLHLGYPWVICRLHHATTFSTGGSIVHKTVALLKPNEPLSTDTTVTPSDYAIFQIVFQ